jgi:hypothetical protein
VSRPSSDSNIYFEVWLPANTWNGKFLSTGEGGYAGALNYTRLGLDGGLDEVLRRGYATAGTDTGHVASDAWWAVGATRPTTWRLRSSAGWRRAWRPSGSSRPSTPTTRRRRAPCGSPGRSASIPRRAILGSGDPNDAASFACRGGATKGGDGGERER